MRRALFGLSLAIVACAPASPPPNPPAAPAAVETTLDNPLVGTTPTTWKTESWQNSPPLSLTSLRGRVVLVRWFMGTSCPYCSATAPALRALHDTYGKRGLTVIGLYHHKEEAPLAPGQFEGFVRDYGFTFPVARDPDWSTLKAWWLDAEPRTWTSVSFLLDRRGVIRGVHPGGRYAPGDPAYAAMTRAIEALLAEPELTRGT